MLLCLGLLAGPTLAGSPTTLGTMRFEAPDAGSGWSAKPVDNGLFLQKQYQSDKGGRSGAIIQVLGPFPGNASSLDASFQRATGGVKELGEERPMAKSEGTTSNGHRIRTDYRCCASMKGLILGQRTIGIASERQTVVLALLGMDLRDEAQDSAEADFLALVRSLRLEPDDEDFALKPRPGDGGLDGVFTHLDTGIRPNAFGGTDFYSESEITVFDPSGLFSTTIPEGGDIAAHCRTKPKDCGLYALKGGGLLSGANEIEIRSVADDFGVIETETKPFERKGAALEIDEGAYEPVPAFGGGTRFSGTWRFFEASLGSTATSSTSIASERLLTFAPDGTFRREGWSGASGTSDTGTGNVGFATGSRPSPAASGRYEVEGYRLDLIGSDGRTERFSIFAPPDEGSDKLLVIDGSNYLRQE